ncbi:hypothetical protein GIB67_041125 [Kingdonia uniflora]|uniref:FYVE-type domain-containing protein n=1 Tax=Kingdonia uniflora TaxID=39325 RepID=A0A7J7LK86_9MAGN|nr:hypothetical protein GIB67_041125 [Kingdonia uniflora]
MGDLTTLAKARQELEDLYIGVPDESVNLSFQHFAELKQQNGVAERKQLGMEPIKEVNIRDGLVLGKLPSIDFSKAIQASKPRQHHVDQSEGVHAYRGQHHIDADPYKDFPSPNTSRRVAGVRNTVDTSLDISRFSIVTPKGGPYQERAGTRRPGIPHSNICTICTSYIYIFRHRCLVCGRVYCRNCVGIGMGDLVEGRKCVECLGRRFSQRYIQRAGKMGCCSRYPSIVKQQELKWAEKGPRRNADRGYGRNGIVTPRSKSPETPRTPTTGDTSSFVTSAQYSAYFSTNQPIPL